MTTTPGARLRELIGRDGGLLLPGVANALTARIVADLGFDAAYVTGAGVTNTWLGLPDLGFVSLPDMAAHVSTIAEVVDVPLVVDADTGYGNAVNVHHAVRVLERAGAAGIQLEDQVQPKRCGHFDGQQVVEQAEMVSKVRAAVDARRDERTVIVARTDARAAHGLEVALERAEAYAAAGADVLFIEGLLDRDELAAAGAAVPGTPKLANIVAGGKTPMLPRAELNALGYAIVLYANAALQAAVLGTQEVLGALHEHGTLAQVNDRLASFTTRQHLVDKSFYDDLNTRYAH
ncbi:isocitrate lyase/PEP mutase family protein [Pseudonocardia spinosispora]|uniref:isocitrate lyase/PEP mutase family protein n=1 Tax=Pseudonocardia spinosispora TaxID=103441 RepID=UPI00041A4C92|nr:oxaloacetate decarboxylase [Pseudonocardia spinosispora]